MKKKFLMAQILECISYDNELHFYEKTEENESIEKNITFDILLELMENEEFYTELLESISKIYLKKIDLK